MKRWESAEWLSSAAQLRNRSITRPVHPKRHFPTSAAEPTRDVCIVS
jgi:hypothetical protein